jgi:hypothetical protein
MPQLSPVAIEHLEQRLGLELTDDYKRFLLSHNGGVFLDDVSFRMADESLKGPQTGTISSFYGINEGSPSDLLWNRSAYGFSRRVPKHIIAIGESSTRERICISLGGG